MTKGLLSYFSLLLVLLPAQGHAQGKRLRGRIIDAQTKQPIPSVLVGIREYGISAYSNQSGYFRLRGLKRLRQDSLRFVAEGYVPHAVPIQRGRTKQLTIQLTKRIPTPAEIAAAASLQRTIEQTVLGLPGTQYAFWLPKEPTGLGQMRAAAFFLGGNGFPKEMFRVRIYRPDGPANTPGTDLLTDNVFYFPTKSLDESGWYRMDLTPFALVVPPGGCFIALEFELSGRWPSGQYVQKYAPTGPVMAPPVDSQHQRVWLYESGKGWKKLEAAAPSLNKFNAMIKVELD